LIYQSLYNIQLIAFQSGDRFQSYIDVRDFPSQSTRFWLIPDTSS